MKKCLVFFFLLFGTIYAKAQTIILNGSVKDFDSKNFLQGVTVRVGETSTATDSLGKFKITVELTQFKQQGIRFTNVGYKQLFLNYTSDYTFDIELRASYVELAEVRIMGTGTAILKKAISRIPNNYPQRPYILTGAMGLQYLRNRSDLFNSVAIVQIYVPSYNANKQENVKLIQNKIDTITDKSLIFIKWIGGYLTVPHADIINNREPFITASKVKDFQYQLMQNRMYHDRNVYVINFSQRDSTQKQKATSGTLYIDTATYAFVGADISYFNVTRYGTLPKSKLQYHIAYSPLGNSWYIQEAFMKGNTIYKNENPTTITNYITSKIDTSNIKPFAYGDIIQENDITQNISKQGDSSIWLKADTLLSHSERYNYLSKLSADITDTIRTNRNSVKQKSSWLNYFTKDNFHYSLTFIKFPVNIVNSPTHISNFVKYGFQIGTYFRLYRSLFFQFEGSGNTGTDKINFSRYAFHLSNDIVLNESAHAITLAPYFGYNLLSIDEKNENKTGRANYFVYGTSGAYEITHNVSLLISVARNHFTLSGNTHFQPTNTTIFAGVLIKR
ncbi:hypothetical protein CKK33_18270 [Mucilaginibacter sp. MD40]|uniref:hypothetical protein n=1 Tax=Mucilaginibacter sp. MD40 TaxID=2029590 RepID=UPI000BACC862|nr:hypothetical protein [Mucilaginibacter sp. MD40]PAW95339.1 hypothetical protein CKK33_18270 [Mucilaginibacter sp. MD40]